MAEPAFASTGDLAEKTVTFAEIGAGLYAYTAEGDPNSGIIVGDDGCMVVDAQATPAMAKDVIARVAEVTDKPIRYVVLSHYHAVRVLGASAYEAQGIVASDATYRLIAERGQEDWDSEFGRFPRLFRDATSIPGLTWPTLTFEGAMSVFLGRREVKLLHLGAGHTAGDIVAWVPDAEVMFSATSSSTARPATAATRICANGPSPSKRSATSTPRPSCRAAATRSRARRRCARRSP